ncbi:hypothetical protein KPA97_69795, partial [Burkholderia cenocepacia]|nr:hypothetical protein [Burkholderia cenocepacia]
MAPNLEPAAIPTSEFLSEYMVKFADEWKLLGLHSARMAFHACSLRWLPDGWAASECCHWS